MTIASLLIGTFISQVAFVILKVFFYRNLNTDSWTAIILFWLAFSILIIAIVRRMGILNYAESFFLTAVWFITSLIVDVVITATVIGNYDMYKTLSYWITYLVLIVVLITFHKKQHVEVRKANRAA